MGDHGESRRRLSVPHRTGQRVADGGRLPADSTAVHGAVADPLLGRQPRQAVQPHRGQRRDLAAGLHVGDEPCESVRRHACAARQLTPWRNGLRSRGSTTRTTKTSTGARYARARDSRRGRRATWAADSSSRPRATMTLHGTLYPAAHRARARSKAAALETSCQAASLIMSSFHHRCRRATTSLDFVGSESLITDGFCLRAADTGAVRSCEETAQIWQSCADVVITA